MKYPPGKMPDFEQFDIEVLRRRAAAMSAAYKKL
jgi:hypothetical protein